MTEEQLSKLSTEDLQQLDSLLTQDRIEAGREDLKAFVSHVDQDYEWSRFHSNYVDVLQLFADEVIKNLIITISTQHGKSELSSRNLPAFLLGLDPNLKIAIGSYSDTFAKDFNRDTQNIIDTPEYHQIFPDTTLNKSNVVTIPGTALRNATVFQVVGHKGELRAVGRGGALTGKSVDIMIMDDLYKDYEEGNSPTIRESVWNWYTSVVTKRLHNDSQQLIVFTRWHEDDLIGRLSQKKPVITINSIDEIYQAIEKHGKEVWIKINFEAIKTGGPTELDPRMAGEALWPQRHSLQKLIEDRDLDPEKFDCMQQGNPLTATGLLYRPFKTYIHLPEVGVKKNKTDTADTGKDYLCSICYVEDPQGYCYVTDVYYTQDAMEITEPETAQLLIRNETSVADIESNNGGRGFARKIKELVPTDITVNWHHQSRNKESRIFSNSANVNKMILFPENWHSKWPEFYNHVRRYKKIFAANKHDDAPDCLTSMVEKEGGGIVESIEWE